jgi:hypothetical protein
MAGFDPGKNSQSVYIRHDQIQQNERKVVCFRTGHKIKGRLATGRTRDRHAGSRDRGLEKSALHRIVIDNEDCVGHKAATFAQER